VAWPEKNWYAASRLRSPRGQPTDSGNNDAGARALATREENELLTRVGPGSPAGELLRRYWQPAALSEELPTGGAPLPVRLFGEDLVLFRDEQDRIGLLGLHCAHRGVDLSYGRLEDGGLRCLYHGWLYNVQGRCLEQPGEPAGSTFHERIRQRAYPCEERGGIIFAYLGAGEPPLLPNYEFLGAPDERRYVTKYFQQCNYLQGSEGNLDPVHNNLLHHPNPNLAHLGNRKLVTFRGGRGPVPGQQRLDFEVTDFGLRLCDVTQLSPEEVNLRMYYFVMPSFTAFPGPQGGTEGFSLNWHVPIDDTRHWKYSVVYSRFKPLDLGIARASVGEGLTPDYHLVAGAHNRYLQDRAALPTESYSGIAGFAAQDAWATESMGPIADRSEEHLGTTDKILFAMRKLLLKGIHDVQSGVDPQHVIRRPEQNRFPQMLMFVGKVPTDTDWKELARGLVARAEERTAVEA
jgi:phthalate 4,5-dioxygenase